MSDTRRLYIEAAKRTFVEGTYVTVVAPHLWRGVLYSGECRIGSVGIVRLDRRTDVVTVDDGHAFVSVEWVYHPTDPTDGIGAHETSQIDTMCLRPHIIPTTPAGVEAFLNG